MIKNILNLVTALTLSAGVIAGGDDRDTGPVESLEVMMPSVEHAVGNHSPSVKSYQAPAPAPKTMKLTVGGKAVSVRAHVACQDKLGLSDSNIAIFKAAKVGGYLYNTGPIESLGTLFSPKRWDSYFTCIDAHGG